MTVPISTVAGNVIDADVVCVGCKYNLRTLAREGKCPECGAPIDASWRRHQLDREELGKLRENGLPWLRAMRGGVTISVVAWLLSITGLLYGDISTGLDGMLCAVWLAPFVAVFVMSYFAAWSLMTPRSRVRLLYACRTVLVIGLAALGMLYINSRWAYYYEPLFRRVATLPSEGFTRAVRTVGIFASIAWPTVTAATFGRLVQLSWLAGRRAIAIGFAVLGVLPTAFVALFPMSLITNRRDAPFPDIDAQLVCILPGATGTHPMIWLSLRGALDRNDAWSVLMLIAYVAILGFLFWSLRKTLSRAIHLSETAITNPLAGSPEANSRS